MNETMHPDQQMTPGPWQWVSDNGGVSHILRSAAPGRPVVMAAGMFEREGAAMLLFAVGRTSGRDGGRLRVVTAKELERHPDARLIRRSREMVDVLDALVKAVGRWPTSFGQGDIDDALERGRALLAAVNNPDAPRSST